MMRKQFYQLQLGTAIVLLAVMFSCAQQAPKEQPVITSLSKEIKEIHAGILEGYLSENEIPNSLNLVPPPPEEGSVAFELDQEIAAMYVASNDEARREQAAKDADLHFPEAVDAFNMVLNTKISEANTPHLYMIMRRTLADAGLSTYGAKNHYQRKRPFMVNNTPTCTPNDEAALRKDGSYPSGHTAIGWTWALILSEVFPAQADVILERGKEFGISRNVCNVHWHSDVVAGRMMGAAAVAKLHANADFMIDLKVAKEEIKALMK
ncbi:acid phosphatase [Labilibacter marinus]|uniref:acid phosphatase n=1 Tax=Labilibacter marinus TaxID=1477105 RepID=UPI00117A9754|nr:phosphatase PAP2 family protein [Labilibacter marinus]